MPNLSRFVVLPVPSNAPLLICLLRSITQRKWLHWKCFLGVFAAKSLHRGKQTCPHFGGPSEKFNDTQIHA